MHASVPIPSLATSRLILRGFTSADAVSLHRILNEPGILQYFPRPDAPDMEHVRGLIERQLLQWKEHGLGWWAVTLQGQSEPIGWNGLQYLPETDEVELAYLLSRRYWGYGYATEGAKAALAYGFETLGRTEIIGLTHPENTASQNVLRKCGMHFVEQRAYFGMALFRFLLRRIPHTT